MNMESKLNKIFIGCIIVFLLSLLADFFIGWTIAGPFALVSLIGILMYWLFYFTYTRGK
jgi:hypothetical protein